MHIQMMKTTVGVAVLLALSAGIVSAQIMTETFHNVSVLTSSQDSDAFTLPEFNTDFGTLEKVDVTFVVMEKAQVRVINNSSAALGFTNASVTTEPSLAGPGGMSYNGSLTATLPLGMANAGMNSYADVLAWDKKLVKVDPANFGVWEGTPSDTVSFTFTRGSSSYAGTGSNELFFGGRSKLREKTIVRYTYLAVPEPPQKYLVSIVALATLILWVRRTRFRRQNLQP